TPESIVAEELQEVITISTVITIIIIISIISISAYIIYSNIKKKRKLFELAYIDPITKLGNYYYFCKEGQKLLDISTNSNNYVIILSIEKFQSFNKHYGHNTGNNLLIEIGNKLNKQNIVCRLSNDVFGIITQTTN